MWEKKDSNRNAANDDFAPPRPPASTGSSIGSTPVGSSRIVNIGQSILVKGELSGSEDLTIDGQVEGKISLKDHNLTIGQHGKIQAELVARTVTILGSVQGNVIAAEKVEIQQGGRLDGDITAPRISIADGAHFRGKVDMESKNAAARKSTSVQTSTAASSSIQSPGVSAS